MSKIQDLIAALDRAGYSPEFSHTGGGCYAIEIRGQIGEYVAITGDDVFNLGDLTSDDNLDGLWAVGHYSDDHGDPFSMVEIRDGLGYLGDVVAAVTRILGPVNEHYFLRDPDEDVADFCYGCGAAFLDGYHLNIVKRAHLHAHRAE